MTALRRVRREPIEDMGPTPETRAKLRPNMIMALYAAEELNESQWVAAQEICEIADAVSVLWFQPLRMNGGDGVSSRSRHWLDNMKPHLQKPYRARYIPWVRAAEHRLIYGHRLSEVVFGVVVDNRRPDEFGPHAEICQALREGLDAY